MDSLNSRITILILEDDLDTANILGDFLSDENFNILFASTQKEFIALNKNKAIDFYLIDLKLPDGNGLDIIRDLRTTSDAGIIVLSGKTSEADRIVGLELGADDYMPKPYCPNELLSRIRSVLRRTIGTRTYNSSNKSGNCKKVSFLGWHMDLVALHLLASDNTEVKLTTTEFKVLSILVKSNNQIVSREELIGRDTINNGRAVDGIISRLRKKLPTPVNAPSLIRSIRHRGYMFTPVIHWHQST